MGKHAVEQIGRQLDPANQLSGWRRPRPSASVPVRQRSRVPWDSSYNLKAIRMVGHSHIRRQIRLLTARVIAAERAAGMNSDDTALAERSMQRHVLDRRAAVGGEVPDQLAFAFQLSSLHVRLSDAEHFRIAQMEPRA
jgi:hypothetical protein